MQPLKQLSRSGACLLIIVLGVAARIKSLYRICKAHDDFLRLVGIEFRKKKKNGALEVSILLRFFFADIIFLSQGSADIK